MNSNYVIWYNRQRNNECMMRDFCGLDKTYPLLAGIPIKDTFPSNTTFSMDPDEPTDTKLTDSLSNTMGVIIVSKRLGDFFRQHDVPMVEYLPTTILNHKSRPISESYEILHPIHPVDCLNLNGVNAQYSLILPENIDELDKIILFEDKIPHERVFFRCLNFYDITLVKRSFAEAITAAGFTGFKWRELSEHT